MRTPPVLVHGLDLIQNVLTIGRQQPVGKSAIATIDSVAK